MWNNQVVSATASTGARPRPTQLRDEAEITKFWRDGPPVVSILCPTFNHAAFVEEAVAGFLSQETHFPYEVILRDDASTDGTAEIIEGLARRYPNIIRTRLETVNQFPATSPWQALLPLARGEFVATCDGDDYWIHPRKIANQVESLRRNGSAVASTHGMIIVSGDNVVQYSRNNGGRDALPSERKLTRLELSVAAIPTPTLLFRNVIEWPGRYCVGTPYSDVFMTAALSMLGGAVRDRGLVAAAYRHHDGGISSAEAEPIAQLQGAVSRYRIGMFFAESGWTEAAQLSFARSVELLSWGALSVNCDPRREVVRRLGFCGRTLRKLRRGIRALTED